jgi:threonine/homoserine/homoserine lactone efflux protein
MSAFELLLRGLIAGFIIAAPVGPVNILCISRTITKGRWAGLISGAGAAAADAFYGSIAGFGISLVIQFLIREQLWIRLFGGILLLLIGIGYYFKQPRKLSENKPDESGHSDFVSTFFLTLTNPTTILSFLAILAGLGMSEARANWLTLMLVVGIFAGSLVWWIILVAAVDRLRDRFNDRSMLWMNRIAGVAIGGFGIGSFLLSLVHSK